MAGHVAKVHASDETLAKMNDALKDGLRRNQSVRHIMASATPTASSSGRTA